VCLEQKPEPYCETERQEKYETWKKKQELRGREKKKTPSTRTNMTDGEEGE
jgi:hypothetical protein